MYSGLHMKIPTSHGMWAVVKDRFRFGTYFVCHDRNNPGFWNCVLEHEVPKSVKRKARCFLSNPTLYGRKGSL